MVFETPTGSLPIAPIKISGQYKIVVTPSGLYFDDYNGRRMNINKGQSFLPQLANFLKVASIVQDFGGLKYGGFVRDKKLFYHSPLYLGNDIPNYFVVSAIGNGSVDDVNTFEEITALGKIADNKAIFDLKELGLHNIFKELLTFEYPLYYTFEEHKITLHGFDYIKGTKTKKEHTLLNFASNQTWFGAVNNYILNLFNDSTIVYPRFVNIEFEFDDNTKYKNFFTNYYGFYSYGESVEYSKIADEYKKSLLGIFTKEIYSAGFKEQKIDIFQIGDKITIPKQDTITYPIHNSGLLDVNNTEPKLTIVVNYVNIGDTFEIYDEYNNPYFTYYVTENNLKHTHYETLVSIAHSIEIESDYQFGCKASQTTLTFTSKNGMEGYFMRESKQINQYNFVDKTNIEEKIIGTEKVKICPFVQVDDFTLVLSGYNYAEYIAPIINNRTDELTHFIEKEGELLEVIKVQTIDGLLLIKVSGNVSSFRNDGVVQIFEKRPTTYKHLYPIPFLHYLAEDDIVKSSVQYNKEEYVKELKEGVMSDVKKKAVASFEKYLLEGNKQFSKDHKESDVFKNDYPYANTKMVLNMKFSNGISSYINPNYFNFDIGFHYSNGNTIIQAAERDVRRFHWFLIKSRTPEYLKNTTLYPTAGLRYFNDIPKITSRLVDTGIYSETVFLGVKYQLPRKYANYNFAVYLDYNNIPDIKFEDTDNFRFDIDHSKKTIYLVIDNYLDFVDLLRNGDVKNEPFIDLSFLYSVNEPYNTNSNLVLSFKTGGILLLDKSAKEINGEIVKDWKYFDKKTNKYLICLKRSSLINTSSLTDLVSGTEATFYVYSKHKDIDFLVMTYNIKGISLVTEEYIWCEDFDVQFYDTKKLLLYSMEDKELVKLTTATESGFTVIDESDISNDNPYSNVTVYVNGNNRKLQFLNPKTKYSFKENYLEAKRKITYERDGQKRIEDTFFDFGVNPNMGLIKDEYKKWFDDSTEEQIITLFDRSQIWKIIKDVMATDLRFKHNTKQQTFNILNSLLLINLADHAELKSIKTNIPNEFIKLKVVENSFNAVIWNLPNGGKEEPEAVKISRISGVYSPCIDILSERELHKFQTITNYGRLVNIYDKNYSNIISGEIESTSLNNTENTTVSLLKKNEDLSVITQYVYEEANAIGNINDVSGNFISSLFVYDKNFEVRVKFSEENMTYQSIFGEGEISISLLDLLKFNGLYNDKLEHIKDKNRNVDEYIMNKGIEFLLGKYYFLERITDNDNVDVLFEENDFKVRISEEQYQQNKEYILIFKRK